MKPKGTTVEIVEVRNEHVHGLMLIDEKDQVWLTFVRPWWDLASWAWWHLSNGSKRWIIIRRGGEELRVRAVRLSRTYYRMGTK